MFKRHFKSLRYFYIVSRQEETRFTRLKNHKKSESFLEKNVVIIKKFKT